MDSGIRVRFDENIDRVNQLIRLYEGLAVGSGRRPVNSTDVLRAAVVMLHAAQEDFCRSLARELLPEASCDALEQVPLAGQNQKTPKKFGLSELAGFRGKSVSDVIQESVEEYLDRSTYNDPGQIKQLVTDLGGDWSTMNVDWNCLGNMMARRHHIVHRADANVSTGKGHHNAKSIGDAGVKVWVACVKSLADEICTQF